MIDHFLPDVATAQDYYPFGMVMPGRTYPGSTASGYRYGFNGKENDNEVKGTGNQIDYGMRYYDPRAGRFMSVDPLTEKYPWYTPYQFAGNKPIWAIDLDGLEEAASDKLSWKQKAGIAVFTVKTILTKTFDWNVSTTGGYRGPLADAGQATVTSAGSAMNGNLHTAFGGAWPVDPSATLGFTPALNPSASNVGQITGAFNPGPYHGPPCC